MTQDMLSLGFDQIIIQLQEMAVSLSARRILGNTEPILNESLCRARMVETTAARRVMENAGTPPLTETEITQAGLAAALQGGMLSPADLCSVARFCAAIRRLRRYLQGAALYSAAIASWHTELPDLDPLEEDIGRSVREDAVLDEASPALRNLRRLTAAARCKNHTPRIAAKELIRRHIARHDPAIDAVRPEPACQGMTSRVLQVDQNHIILHKFTLIRRMFA